MLATHNCRKWYMYYNIRAMMYDDGFIQQRRINVSVQHNGGFLPGNKLLTQCYYHWGARLNAMKSFCFVFAAYYDPT